MKAQGDLRLFTREVFSQWKADMGGIAGIILSAISAYLGWTISAVVFSLAALACLFIAFYYAWLKQHDEVGRLHGERQNRQTKLDLMALILTGRELLETDPVESGKFHKWIDDYEAWIRSKEALIARVFPEHANYFRHPVASGTGGIAPLKDYLRHAIPMLEALYKSL